MSEQSPPEDIQVGDLVRVRADVLERYLVALASKLRGRTGRVERVFVPMGGTKKMARVQWLKRGNRGHEFFEYMPLRDIEAAPTSQGE